MYSTCTLAPEEDEAVLDALLNRYPQQIALESVERVLPIPAPGLTHAGEQVFHPDVSKAVRLWPHPSTHPPHRPAQVLLESGLADTETGIRVDYETLKTKWENVYAIGDCAAHAHAHHDLGGW